MDGLDTGSIRCRSCRAQSRAILQLRKGATSGLPVLYIAVSPCQVHGVDQGIRNGCIQVVDSWATRHVQIKQQEAGFVHCLKSYHQKYPARWQCSPIQSSVDTQRPVHHTQSPRRYRTIIAPISIRHRQLYIQRRGVAMCIERPGGRCPNLPEDPVRRLLLWLGCAEVNCGCLSRSCHCPVS